MPIDPNSETSDIGQMYRQYLQSKGMPLTNENMSRVISQSQREPGMIAGLSVQGAAPQMSASPPPNVAGASGNSSGGALPIPPIPPTAIPPSPAPPPMSLPHAPFPAPASASVPAPSMAPQPANTSSAAPAPPILKPGTPPQQSAQTPPPGQAPGPAQIAQSIARGTPLPTMQSPANMLPVDISGGVPPPPAMSLGAIAGLPVMRPESFKQTTEDQTASMDPITGQPNHATAPIGNILHPKDKREANAKR